MLAFLANLLDQMDLALEHIKKGGVHDARFGLILVDNSIELAMHELATTKNEKLNRLSHVIETYPHRKDLEEATGHVFEAKLKFAKLGGLITEEQSRTISLVHDIRNELYHVGLQHEEILPSLACFYFSTVCDILSRYPINGFGYSYGIKLSERSRKYLTSRGKYSPAEADDFPKACRTMAARCGHKKADIILALTKHMDSIVAESDLWLGIAAKGVYESQRQTRDQATIECQVWPLSFSEEGHKYARAKGFAGKTRRELLEWLKANYPLRFKRDPIPSWRKQVARLRAKGNPHTALENYVAFVDHTAQVRQAFREAAAAAEQEIDRLVDVYRERRNEH